MSTKISAILVLGLVISGRGQGKVSETTLVPTINISPPATEASVTSFHTPLPEAAKPLGEAYSFSQT
jgi:hypothetical protein